MLTEKEHIIKRKIILLEKGFTAKKLADVIEHKHQGTKRPYTRQQVTKAINGYALNEELHKSIVAKLGVSLLEFWPEIYGDNTVSHDAKVNELNNAVN